MLPSSSLLCSLHDSPKNLRDAALRKENNFVQKGADKKDGRLAIQNNLLFTVWMSGSFTDLRRRGGITNLQTAGSTWDFSAREVHAS